MRQFIFIATFIVIPAYSQTVAVAPAAVMGGIVSGAFTSAGMGVSSRSNGADITFNYNIPKGAAAFAVTGAPWSGRQVNQTVRTLANGTHLTQQAFEQPMTYRDSMGRVRTESRMQRAPMIPGVVKTAPQIASLPEIEDPVAGY